MSYTSSSGGSTVQINRLLGGWSWNVTVESDGNNLEQLQAAKAKAFAIAFEVRDDLAGHADTPKQELEQQVSEIQF